MESSDEIVNPNPDDLPEGLHEKLMVEAAAHLKDNPPSTAPLVVDGPETAGTIVKVGDKELQLKPDVYVFGIVSFITCVEGTNAPCPKPPIMILRHLGNEDSIAIEMVSGKIIENDFPDHREEWERIKGKFLWLYDELEVKISE